MRSIGPLPYSPPHLDDETLYSFLGRTNAYNCAGSTRTFLHQVFGDSKAMSSADLPTSLAAMIDGWPEVSPYPSVKEVIERTTQYPYHRPFMPAQRWEELVARASDGPGQSLKTWLGLVAHRFGASATFRSCVTCDRAAWDTEGVLYWHRAHLLPGVVICPIHHIPLIEHFVQSRDGARSALRRLPATGTPIRLPRSALAPLINFAVTSYEVLRSTPDGITGDLLPSTYLTRLNEMGLCRESGRIRWRDLSLLLMQSNRGFEGWQVGDRITQASSGVLGWLYGLLQGRDSLSHPLTHILLVNCLFGSHADFEMAIRSANASPNNVPSEALPLAADPIADGSVSCRAAALRIGVSVTTVVQRRRVLGLRIAERRKSLTPARIAEATSMLRSGASVAMVSKATRLSFSSVYRIRATIPLAANEATARSHADLVASYRARWLATEICGGPIRQRRVLDGAVYAWLYRNDREWLTKGRGHVPSSPDRKGRRSRIDWDKRDENYARRLAAIATDLKARSSRRRISRSRLIRATAPESSIRANLHRLPRYRDALQVSSETIPEFQRRRYDFAVAELSNEDGVFPRWKALRLAGLHRVPLRTG